VLTFLIDVFVYYDIVISMKLISMIMSSVLTHICLEKAAAAGLEQRTESFAIVLQGSVAEVMPLFGPLRETEWAPTWAPHFLHPPEGAQREGVVFKSTTSNGKEGLWLLTSYNISEGRVEYVSIIPGFTANEIKIRVVPERNGGSKATITYRRSALAPDGNEEVTKLDAHWADRQRAHWETAINAVLTTGSAHD